METKATVACWLALVAMVISGVLAHRDAVIRFHQDTKSHPQQLRFKPGHKDRGYVKNCAPGGTFFNVSWYPKEVNPTEEIKFFANVVSPVNLEQGRVKATLWYEGNPMISIDREVKCQELSKAVEQMIPSHALHVSCPIKKGQLLTGYYVFPNTERLIGYDGNYKMKAQVWNDNKEQLLCIDVEVEVLPY